MLDAHDIVYLVNIHFEFFGDLLGGRLTVKFGGEFAGSTKDFIDSFNHVDWDTNGAGLVGDGARDGLADPPGSVSGEFETLAWVKLLDSAKQTSIALLDEV